MIVNPSCPDHRIKLSTGIGLNYEEVPVKGALGGMTGERKAVGHEVHTA